MLGSNLLWLIITIITSAIEWFVIKLILDEASKLKSSILIANLSLLLPFAISVIMQLIDINVVLKLVINASIVFIYYKLNYKTTFIKNIFISLLITLLIVIVDTIAFNIVLVTHSLPSNSIILQDNIYRLKLIIISKTCYILVIPMIISFKLAVEINKKESFFISIPIVSNIVCLVLILNLVFLKNSITSSVATLMLIISFILLFASMSLVFAVSKIIKYINIKNENDLVLLNIKSQYKHYLSLEKAKLGIDMVYDTENNFLNLILTEKQAICDENNIGLNVSINDFTLCNFLDTADVCSLFSTIIDSSIEALKTSKSNIKTITLDAKVACNFYIIKVTNSDEYLKIVKEVDHNKESVFSEGVEVNCINRIVEKYHGVLEISDDKLILVILIPLKQNIMSKEGRLQ